jgi:hypothetical protein
MVAGDVLVVPLAVESELEVVMEVQEEEVIMHLHVMLIL